MKAILLFTILLTVSVAVSAQSTQLPQPSEMVTIPLFDTTLLRPQMAVDFIMGVQGLAHVRNLQQQAKH